MDSAKALMKEIYSFKGSYSKKKGKKYKICDIMVYVKSKETNGELLEIERNFIQIYLHLATKPYCFLVFTLVYKSEGLCPFSLLIHNPVRLTEKAA